MMISFFYKNQSLIQQMQQGFLKSLFRRGNLFLARIYVRIVYGTFTSKTKVRRFVDEEPTIIVSFTTFGERSKLSWITLESIFRQSQLPDRILIWVAKDDLKAISHMSKLLERYADRGVELNLCQEDIRSHKKYYYTMLKYPSSLVITLDDDIVYHNRMIEFLMYSHHQDPTAIICMRAHVMKYSEGRIAPYSEWKKCVLKQPVDQSEVLFFTSGGGTLFPPGSLPEETFQKDRFLEFAPLADDVWLNCMARLKGTRIIKANQSPSDVISIIEDGEGLAKFNVDDNQNDRQLHNVVSEYSISFKELFHV